MNGQKQKKEGGCCVTGGKKQRRGVTKAVVGRELTSFVNGCRLGTIRSREEEKKHSRIEKPQERFKKRPGSILLKK